MATHTFFIKNQAVVCLTNFISFIHLNARQTFGCSGHFKKN